MTDVVNPKSASPDQLLPYHKKISAEGKALMICFISYTYMVLKSRPVLAAVPTLRRCCGVVVFSCKGVVRPLVGARTMYPVFTFLMMITSFKALCPYE